MTRIAPGPSATRAQAIADAMKEANDALALAQKRMAEAAKLAEGDHDHNADRPADLAAALRVVAGQITIESHIWRDYADARKSA